MTSTGTRNRGSRGTPGFVNAVISVVIIVLVAALSLTAAQTPPPAIAELAPSAVQQIKDAPSEQTSAAGEGEGGAAGGGLTTTTSAATIGPDGRPLPPTTAPGTIVRARVRRCVGNPPRQTEDPQSPPCVPYFEGDNGGATAKGVTPDQIRIVHGGGGHSTAQILINYFNKRFEMYGRRLVLEGVGTGDATCPTQKGAAAGVAKEKQAFAVIDSADGNKQCFHAELARLKVISATTVPYLTEPDMAANHPYMWSYVMSYDKGMTGIGAMVCNRLKGGNAVHSGDPLYLTNPRRFGIIMQELEGDRPSRTESLERALAACGLKAEEIIRYKGDLSTDQVPLAQNAIVRMKTAQVSTVICICTIFIEQFISAAATNQAYFPEWILSTYFGNDFNVAYKLFWTQEQRKSIFGVGTAPPMRSGRNEPAVYAYQEVNPVDDPKLSDQLLNMYRSLLLLSSGIQMAGPNLTPDTFAAGLHKTRFPYPQDDPSQSGDVGFLDRDHTMTDDYNEFWWSEAAVSPNLHASWSNGDPGALCYPDGGRRRKRDAWPKGDIFFTTPCTPDPGG